MLSSKIEELLNAQIEKECYSSQLYLAMARQQQGARDEAKALLQDTEETFRPIAVAELQSPFTIHHDDLAVWLALQEARQFIRNCECIHVP